MSTFGLINASILVCEATLIEKNDVVSAIRIIDTLTFPASATNGQFHVVTLLRAHPFDIREHSLIVQMVNTGGQGQIVAAQAQPMKFSYGSDGVNALSPKGFRLDTTFTVELAALGGLGTYDVQALLDGQLVAQTPFTLRRR